MIPSSWRPWVLRLAAAATIPLCAHAAAGNPSTSAAEAAIRQADADWAEAAGTGSVEAWMTYYAADAVVLAPHQPMATTPALIRQSVAQLLGLPRLAISWHPVKVEVAADGDMAYLIGAYQLRYDDPRSGPTQDRGKLLEVWRRQGDGRWKCIADTWNSDGAGSQAPPPPPAPDVPASRAPPAPAAAPVAPVTPAAPTAPVAPQASAEYGAMPENYEATVRQYFQNAASDPDSVRYREITRPEKTAIKAMSGTVLLRQSLLKGWGVKATIDAKNSHGVYVGFKTYEFLFRGEKIVHTTSPLGGDEMK